MHVKDRNQIEYRNSCILYSVATENKHFEKAKLASCWEDKTEQKGFPLEKEEMITCSEEGVFSDILVFSWYDSYCAESWGMNCATVTQIIKCV